ncbi:protein of unknown function [Streptomyces murinus]
MWSPRMRGWSRLAGVQQAVVLVVPAHAGVVPSSSRRRGVIRRGPRACGGGPIADAPSGLIDLWSPRMRGWSLGLQVLAAEGCVVPAHAGVVPGALPRAGRRSRGPRACGGGPAEWTQQAVQLLWSPRMRGWSPRVVGRPTR